MKLANYLYLCWDTVLLYAPLFVLAGGIGAALTCTGQHLLEEEPPKPFVCLKGRVHENLDGILVPVRDKYDALVKCTE